MERHELSDAQWEKIKDFLPDRKGHVGRNGLDNRKFINAVFWISKTGSPWRDLPKEKDDWKNTHRRFSRWAKKNIWEKIFKALSSDADLEYVMLDSTTSRAHQHSAGGKGGLKKMPWVVQEEDLAQKSTL